MECRTETEIERGAVQLLRTGWRAGTDEASAPGDLRPLLLHARECVRCRELLELFLETERRLQESMQESMGAATAGRGGGWDRPGWSAEVRSPGRPPERVLKLLPPGVAEEISPPPGGGETGGGPAGDPTLAMPARASLIPDAAPDGEPYDLAADAGEGRDDSSVPAQGRTLTLVTDDDHYLVRIVAAEGGGARAMLVRFQFDSAPEAGPSPALKIGETEYRFDHTGAVDLPAFPGESVFLVLR